MTISPATSSAAARTDARTRAATLLIGRAGTGKTQRCLLEIAREVRRSPRGTPLVMLVPEQVSAQMERRLVELVGDPLGGFTRARVLSFNHLAHEALADAPATAQPSSDGPATIPRPTVSETARVMLLRRALRLTRAELQILRGAAEVPGMAEVLSAALLDLQRYGWRPATLATAIPNLPQAARPLAAKLVDMHRVWTCYAALLDVHGLEDISAFWERAARAIARWPGLRGARVWIDGFSSFTAHELGWLESLLTQAEELTITLGTQSPSPPREGMRPRMRVGAERLFDMVEDTRERLAERLTRLGWDVRTLELPAEGQPTRFSANAALAHLECNVLGRLQPLVIEPHVWARALVEPAERLPGPPIELLEGEDRRAELEAVARRIVALCRVDAHAPATDAGAATPPLTWRDVAVLARELAPYEALIHEVFGQFEIPYFIDRPRTVAGHPLARLLLTGLRVLRDDFSGDSVRRHIKCGLCGEEDDDTLAALENLLLEYDPRSRRWREVLAERGLHDAWRRIEAPLVALERALLRDSASPAQALWSLLDAVRAGDRLGVLQAAQRAAGDEEQAQLHDQAWSQLVAWLEDLHLVAGAGGTGPSLLPSPAESRGAYFDELLALADSGLAVTRARLIPPTINQVTIGSVDRSRPPEVAVLFMLGMNLGEFPRLSSPDPLLNDQDRDRLLAAQPGAQLGPTSRQKRVQEHYLAYMALTRPSRRLVGCRCLKDEEGRATDPSPYFTALATAYPAAPRRLVGRGAAGEATAEDSPLALGLRPEEWGHRLARALDEPAELAAVAQLLGLLAAGDPLRDAAISEGARRQWLAARQRQIAPPRAHVSAELAHAYWSTRGRVSTTALERYAACPFRFFFTDMLRLKERASVELDQMDLGILRHALLQGIFNALRGADAVLDWGTIDLRAADDWLAQRLAELPRENERVAKLIDNPLEFAKLRKLVREVGWFVRLLRQAGCSTRLRQWGAEWRFSGPEAPRIVSPSGLELELEGSIDRIDRVELDGTGAANGPIYFLFDYKSGGRRVHVERLRAGIDLQPTLYAWALLEQLRTSEPAARVGGFFYWGLRPPLLAPPDEQATPPAADELPRDWLSACRASGFFDEALAPLLDTQCAPGESSLIYPFTLTKQGKLHGNGRAHWPRAGIERLIEEQVEMTRERLGEIAAGRIAAAPWVKGAQSACTFCSGERICRRCEPAGIELRPLDSLNRKTLLAAWGIA